MFVVDDRAFVRTAVGLAVAAEPRIRIVGEASGAREAAARLEELRPDLVLLDVPPAREQLADAVELVSSPSRKVVVFSATAAVDAARAAAAGADGFVAKTIAAGELSGTLLALASGSRAGARVGSSGRRHRVSVAVGLAAAAVLASTFVLLLLDLV